MQNNSLAFACAAAACCLLVLLLKQRGTRALTLTTFPATAVLLIETIFEYDEWGVDWAVAHMLKIGPCPHQRLRKCPILLAQLDVGKVGWAHNAPLPCGGRRDIRAAAVAGATPEAASPSPSCLRRRAQTNGLARVYPKGIAWEAIPPQAWMATRRLIGVSTGSGSIN